MANPAASPPTTSTEVESSHPIAQEDVHQGPAERANAPEKRTKKCRDGASSAPRRGMPQHGPRRSMPREPRRRLDSRLQTREGGDTERGGGRPPKLEMSMETGNRIDTTQNTYR
eukprot:scaffold625_cov324-Pavlova_lutheri.AAC.69